MRSLFRSFVGAFGLLLIAGVMALFTFNVGAAALGWPGLIIVNAICAHWGIYLREYPTWMWLLPAFLIDLLLYTMLFFVFAKCWTIASAKFASKRDAAGDPFSPTTNDRRRTTL